MSFWATIKIFRNLEAGVIGTFGGPVGVPENPARRADEPKNVATVTRGLWRAVTVGSPQTRSRVHIGSILPWLAARIRRLVAFAVMHAVAPLRNRSGEPTYARARVESVKIEEKYQYRQEISLNADVSEVGDPAGQIKIVQPYDGDEFFTRDAYADVETARRGGAVSTDEAVVGFLGLADYEKTDLEGPLGLQGNYGSVPIAVRLPGRPGPDETDQLIIDNSECVVSREYRPEALRIVPVHVDMELDDPDTAESSDRPQRPSEVDGIADLLARLLERIKAIGNAPERQLDFEPGLWLRVTVRLHLPRGQADGVEAKVSKVSMSWPTHTSLSSLELHTDSRSALQYNPEQEHDGRKGGLEWSDVPMTLIDQQRDAENMRTADGSEVEDEDPEIRKELVTLTTGEMTLSISNPGDFYKRDTISGRIEVTVNRLLSGMDARLYDAAGKPYPARRSRLKLASTVTTEFSLPLYDAFVRRAMSPYQWLYFDEVIPSALRLDDIAMALRNRGFRVFSERNPDPADCCIEAERVQGPDLLRLQVYVRGERHKARRERSVDGVMTYRTAVDSGDLRLYVYGSLRGESKPVVQEINALRRALRERFDRLPAGR
jgi:hypothetical protein